MNTKPITSQQYQILKERPIETVVSKDIDETKLWFGKPPKDHTFSQSHYHCPLKLPEVSLSLHMLALPGRKKSSQEQNLSL